MRRSRRIGRRVAWSSSPASKVRDIGSALATGVGAPIVAVTFTPSRL
jgi:hypothetical protein